MTSIQLNLMQSLLGGLRTLIVEQPDYDLSRFAMEDMNKRMHEFEQELIFNARAKNNISEIFEANSAGGGK